MTGEDVASSIETNEQVESELVVETFEDVRERKFLMKEFNRKILREKSNEFVEEEKLIQTK